MANSTIINLVIVFILFHTIHATNEGAQRARAYIRKEKKSYYDVRFDIEKEEYPMLHEKLIAAALRNTNFEAKGVKVLPGQTGSKQHPPEWILLDLATRHGVTTIALRNDNLNLIAFTNSKGDWYAFAPRDDLLPFCNPLNFGETYHDLLGKYSELDKLLPFNYSELGNLLLSKEIAIEAVGTLLKYDHHSDSVDDDLELKYALAKLILIVCEALRFKDIRSTIASGWDTESQITKPERVRHWGTISRGLIIGWKDDGVEDGVKDRVDFETIKDVFHLENKDDYPSLLHVLLCPGYYLCGLA